MVRMRTQPRSMVLHDWGVLLSSFAREYGSFAWKTLILLVLLTVIGACAPAFPIWLYPLIVIVYAFVASIGKMYNVVVNRRHKQIKYNANSRFSRFNRRWVFRFWIYFVIYLASGSIFLIQSPAWDLWEWIVIWAGSLIFFFPIYLIARRLGKSQYSAEYIKAQAMVWTIVAITVLMTLVYASISMWTASGDALSLREILENRSIPYNASESVLLNEIDKYSTYFDFVVQFGLGELTRASYLSMFVVKLVTGASVFFGIAGLLSFCLLDRDEIRSEFVLLPAEDSDERETSVTARYFGVLGGTACAFLVLFFVFEGYMTDLKNEQGYILADQVLAETTERIVLATEYDPYYIADIVDKELEDKEFLESIDPRRNAVIEEYGGKLSELIDEYYDGCIGNVDSYMEWYDSVPGQFARFATLFGQNMALDEFETRVIQPESGIKDEIEFVYQEYIRELGEVYSDYIEQLKGSDIAQSLDIPDVDDKVSELNDMLVLWPFEDNEATETLAKGVLLLSSDNLDFVKESIIKAINGQRELALIQAAAIPEIFFVENVVSNGDAISGDD